MNAIYCDKSLTATTQLTQGCFDVGYYTQRAGDKTEPNQDALLVTPLDETTLLLAIADGVGGAPQGHKASRQLVNSLNKAMNKYHLADASMELGALRNHIIDIIEKTNQALTNDSGQTTLTLCLLQKNRYCSVQIGDSGMIHCGLRGKIKYRTLSQSPIGYAVKAGLMSEAEGQHHPDNHFVDNVVGTKDMKIEIGPTMPLARYDTLVLASDGLFDNLLDNDVVNIVRKDTLKSACQSLCQQCQQDFQPRVEKKFLKDDDISFIVCRLNR